MTTRQIVGGMLRRNVTTETVVIENGMPSVIVMNDGENANFGAIDEHDIPSNDKAQGGEPAGEASPGATG